MLVPLMWRAVGVMRDLVMAPTRRMMTYGTAARRMILLDLVVPTATAPVFSFPFDRSLPPKACSQRANIRDL
jgi:hypothetical protein